MQLMNTGLQHCISVRYLITREAPAITTQTTAEQNDDAASNSRCPCIAGVWARRSTPAAWRQPVRLGTPPGGQGHTATLTGPHKRAASPRGTSSALRRPIKSSVHLYHSQTEENKLTHKRALMQCCLSV